MEGSAAERRTPALTTDSREDVRRECEKLGELVVQAKLESGHFGTGEAFAWEWLLEQHYRRLREGESAERERAERALKAAEEAASAARAARAGALPISTARRCSRRRPTATCGSCSITNCTCSIGTARRSDGSRSGHLAFLRPSQHSRLRRTA